MSKPTWQPALAADLRQGDTFRLRGVSRTIVGPIREAAYKWTSFMVLQLKDQHFWVHPREEVEVMR